MDARLNAIVKDANDGVESDIPKVKDAVLRSIAKFAALSSGRLDTLLKGELKLREDIALMGQEATNAYAEAAAQTYKARGDDFYDELTITDNWTLQLATRDAELGVAAAKAAQEIEEDVA